MKNYWLTCELEREDRELLWDSRHVQLLESLIRPTAQFGIELKQFLGQLSIFDYGTFIDAHESGSCDQDRVREWVYLSFFQKAVQDANAVVLLRSGSFLSQALNLLRSLFQTDVVCQYIGERLSEDHLTCRYLIHSILRPTIRRWEEVDKICNRLGEQAYYGTEKIEPCKRAYKRVFGKEFDQPRQDYEWTHEPKHKSFEAVARATSADMVFYRIANNEVHPLLELLPF